MCCVFQPGCNVALLRSHGNSLENVWRIGAARHIDFGVAVVGPGDSKVFVAHASHVGIFVLTANDQSVLGPDDNGTEHACSHNTAQTSYRKSPGLHENHGKNSTKSR